MQNIIMSPESQNLVNLKVYAPVYHYTVSLAGWMNICVLMDRWTD